MVDITHKANTLREATAQAVVRTSNAATIEAIIQRTVPKGDVFEMAKAAGLLGVKKTPDLLPDCHPLPIEYAGVRYQIEGLDIYITMHVKTIYKTGVEVEAMHGVSVVALTMYDMLKPIDKNIEILTIKLLEKKGGKSDYIDKFRRDLRATVVVCSDTIAAGKKEDKAGNSIVEKLKQFGVTVEAIKVIPDEAEDIARELMEAEKGTTDILIYTGGTGLSIRDVTPETLRPLLDREIPGMAEQARNYGQQRTPYSMLSRSLAGTRSGMLVLALPGSTKGASETMDALFPHAMHVFRIMKGARHD
jgi:molybdenum cofactor biosynthesis protein MoaC